MQEIRMIATDLDGTLLRRDKTVSAYTLDVLRRLKQKGVLFAVATARPMRTMHEDLSFLQPDAGVFHNGAAIWDGQSRIGGFAISDPAAAARGILASFPQSRVSVESEEMLYANYDAGETWPGIAHIRTADFSELDGKAADKMIIEAAGQEDVGRIARLLPPNVYAQLCENRLVLCMHKDASKPKGLALLAKLHGISLAQAVCFGDDHNDIAMMRSCGRGIAVANAIDEVKRAADEITLSCEEDGVARWIEQNIL